MALTTLLEKAILNGWAKFEINNFAFSNFGRIQIPKGSTVIITHIKWYPFFNAIEIQPEMLYKELFRYNEYQLKIDGKKSTNFLVYRNSNDLLRMNNNQQGNINLNSPIVASDLQNNWLYKQKDPIHTDTYFMCEEYIKLTVTRNAFVKKVNDTTGVLNNTTDELPPQKGLENVKILLRTNLSSPSKNLNYVMGSLEDANLTAAPSNNTHTANYMQDIDDPQSIFSDLKKSDYPYLTHPLIQIGYVTINNQYFDRLQNM